MPQPLVASVTRGRREGREGGRERYPCPSQEGGAEGGYSCPGQGGGGVEGEGGVPCPGLAYPLIPWTDTHL